MYNCIIISVITDSKLYSAVKTTRWNYQSKPATNAHPTPYHTHTHALAYRLTSGDLGHTPTGNKKGSGTPINSPVLGPARATSNLCSTRAPHHIKTISANTDLDTRMLRHMRCSHTTHARAAIRAALCGIPKVHRTCVHRFMRVITTKCRSSVRVHM